MCDRLGSPSDLVKSWGGGVGGVTVACGVLSAGSVFAGYRVVIVHVTCSTRPAYCVYMCIQRAGKSGINTAVRGPRVTLSWRAEE